MIVVATSALLAVLLGEPKAPACARAIEAGLPCLLSAANLLEAAIVIESRKGDGGGRELDLLLYRAGIEVVPVNQIRRRSRDRLGGDTVRVDIRPA